MKISFTKMQALGNDFVVIDATKKSVSLSKMQIQKMADRHLGIGFDQLLILEASKDSSADFVYRIFNADGSEVAQCGNGARCIGRFIKENHLSEKTEWILQTLATRIKVQLQNDKQPSVEMGIPKFDSKDIPFQENFAQKIEHTHLFRLSNTSLKFAVANLGNPHAVIQVNKDTQVDLKALGSEMNQHPAFPSGVNVGLMEIMSSTFIRLSVYERGVGETSSCGSGACAAMVIGRRLGLLENRVKVAQPGGDLTIEWEGEGSTVKMAGPAEFVFQGEIDLDSVQK